jgi:LEA14-like dessication related protein
MARPVILLTAAALLLGGCGAFQHQDPLQVTLVGIEPAAGAGEGLEMRMQLKLRMQNPNETAIPYDGIYVEVRLLNRNFGTGVSRESGTVPPFGEAVVAVPLEVSILGLAGDAMSLLGGKGLDKIAYEMDGKLSSASSGTVRFKSQGELSVADVMGGGT